MNYIDIENEITLLEGADKFEEAANIIFKCFCIDKIIVCTNQKIENSIEINGNILDVYKFHDSKFKSLEELIDFGHRMIKVYDMFLNKIYKQGGDYLNMQLFPEYIMASIENEKKIHDINNRFSFSRKNPFVIQLDKELYPVAYENLKFNQEIRDQLKECFRIRYEIFEELRIRTSLYISKINSEFWRITPIKTNVQARQIIMCFFIAVEKASEYLKLNKQNTDLLLTVYRNILGLDPTQFRKFKNNNSTKDLEWKFRQIIENQFNWFSKPPR